MSFVSAASDGTKRRDARFCRGACRGRQGAYSNTSACPALELAWVWRRTCPELIRVWRTADGGEAAAGLRQSVSPVGQRLLCDGEDSQPGQFPEQARDSDLGVPTKKCGQAQSICGHWGNPETSLQVLNEKGRTGPYRVPSYRAGRLDPSSFWVAATTAFVRDFVAIRHELGVTRR